MSVVLLGTPIDRRRRLRVRHPVARVTCEVEEAGGPWFEEFLAGL